MEERGNNNIFHKFKSLFIPISKDLEDEFYCTIARESYIRVIIISIMYLLFEIVLRLIKTVKGGELLDTFSVSIIIFHIMIILISFCLKFKKTRVNGRISQFFIELYCVVLVYWAVNISLGQINRTGSITMFILTLTGTSALFYRRSLITLITNFGFYIYFVLNIKLSVKVPKVLEFGKLPLGPPPPGKFPVGNPTPGPHPIRNLVTSFFTDVNIYITDALLITVICCGLGIIVYRLRLKVFLERKALEDLITKDSMTNLLNHKNICNSLKKEIKRSERSLQPVSILMTDIDHFKMINDTYGHQVGDQVIIKVAKLLSETCRETDYVGRYGGEEFLVVLVNTGEDDAMKFGERLRKEIEKTDFGLPSQVTISAGVKMYENESPEDMIKLADKALYQAKEKGRNCVVSA